MAQLSYDLYQNAAFAGMLADSRENDILSYSAEGAISFARPVVLGTDKARQVVNVGTGAGQGALVFGVAVATQAVEQTSAGVVQYADKTTVSVLRRGAIWVTTQDAVVAGAVANLHLASGTFTDEAVAAGIEAFGQLSVRFLTGTTGAGLAIVDVQPK